EWRSEVRRRLAGLPLDPARADDIVDELAQHLEQRYEELLGRGTAAAEAERLLREELADGNVLADELRRLERAAEPPPAALGAPPPRDAARGRRAALLVPAALYPGPPCGASPPRRRAWAPPHGRRIARPALRAPGDPPRLPRPAATVA